jgi:methylated-DNA-protein-cysteine methyltransferase related protein
MFAALRAAVRKVPRGRVATYGDVARAAGFPTGSRQVAWALRGAGPALPWHRILGKGGKILLRGANGVEQAQRLEAEGVIVHGARVNLELFGHDFDQPRNRKVTRRTSR